MNSHKIRLAQLNASLDEQIRHLGQHAVHDIASFIHQRTQAIDEILCQIFDELLHDELALFAVGGYGRGELFPHSDVDILLLGNTKEHQARIEIFVATLWDIGITPAISVRTIDETIIAISDHTVATALLEARWLRGNHALAHTPINIVKQTWTMSDFYHAKMSESKARHLAHNATEYNLEPNIKNAVGALRDLHIILWLGKFYFENIKSFDDLVTVGFLAPDDATKLTHAQQFLWCLRHHLHTHVGRGDDRLLFDRQRAVALSMGYASEDDNHQNTTHALETLMRIYYRHAMTVASLSELLCAYFYESYLQPHATCTTINEHFYLLSQTQSEPKIAVHDLNIFQKNPALLLEIFLVMGKHGIKHIFAPTLQALHLATPMIDEAYRDNPTHKALFLANLQEPNYLFHRLRLMKRFGVLGAYLPAFGQIMGLMQYDLFHRYTVDAHTLLLIRILHRLGDSDNDTYQQKFGLVSQIYEQIHRKDILVITALFHDIAKGRGGDHSELGAVLVHEFCQSHGMTDSDSEFCAWLVREHLTMSLTAQKQDISDPSVITRFAKFVGSISRLNHLYVLTVADMNATNGELWNSWRASLLKQLYISTRRVLDLGVEVIDKDDYISSRKQKAQALLTSTQEIDLTALHELWEELGEEYFLKQQKIDIAWQSEIMLNNIHAITTHQPIIALRPHTDLALDAIQLFLCTPDREDLFATSVCVLDSFGLSVLDATIFSTTIFGVPSALDSYVLIDRFAKRDEKGRLMSEFLENSDRRQELTDKLKNALLGNHGDCSQMVGNFAFNTTLKHFTVPTKVHGERASTLAHQGHHTLSLVTKDRPALLATIGQIFCKVGVAVHGARITTLGERAEDMFYVSDKNGKTLSDEKLNHLKQTLIEILG